jgi:peroxiredoxin
MTCPMLRRGGFALLGLFACGGPKVEPVPVDETAEAMVFPKSRGGEDLLGRAAKGWDAQLPWLDREGMGLADMSGKVVLVRFWTDTCPFCAASAPGLQQLHESYERDGLAVVGFFHPKPRGAERSNDAIRDRAKELGITFPIAIDAQWQTLDRWWLKTGTRSATSVSFLLDKQGVIRFVHPGPELHPSDDPEHAQCQEDFAALEKAVKLLLQEPAA